MPEKKPEPEFWSYQDEVEYTHLKMRYSDRAVLLEEAVSKRKALQDIGPDNPLYHRIAFSAEMARQRVDMAYILDRNTKLEEQLSTVAFLHQRVDILEGAYGHIKMLAEAARIDYVQITNGLKEIAKLKKEVSNGIKQCSDGINGAEGNVLPRKDG